MITSLLNLTTDRQTFDAVLGNQLCLSTMHISSSYQLPWRNRRDRWGGNNVRYWRECEILRRMWDNEVRMRFWGECEIMRWEWDTEERMWDTEENVRHWGENMRYWGEYEILRRMWDNEVRMRHWGENVRYWGECEILMRKSVVMKVDDNTIRNEWKKKKISSSHLISSHLTSSHLIPNF